MRTNRAPTVQARANSRPASRRPRIVVPRHVKVRRRTTHGTQSANKPQIVKVDAGPSDCRLLGTSHRSYSQPLYDGKVGGSRKDIASSCLRITVPGTPIKYTSQLGVYNAKYIDWHQPDWSCLRTDVQNTAQQLNRVTCAAPDAWYGYVKCRQLYKRYDNLGCSADHEHVSCITRAERRDGQLERPEHVLRSAQLYGIKRFNRSNWSSAEVRLLAPANMAISNFHIELRNDAAYRPGETVSGQVIMDVWARTEVRHVEFTLRGEGTVRIFKNSFTFIERPKHEVYLNKRILLISPPDGATSVILNPGRYISDFSYCLPDCLPPSVHQFDMGNGYMFDISYSAQANVCDSVGTRYIQPLHENYHKVIKSVKRNFQVLSLNDWQSLPGAHEPVHYTEKLLLLCSCTSQPTKVHVTLDRGVYPIGGKIKVRLKVTNPGRKQSVKVIRANLEQRMIYKDDLIQKFRKMLISIEDDVEYSPHSEIRTGFDVPVPQNIVPSYLPNCSILDVTYTMKVTVKFKGVRGKLTVSVPVVITPITSNQKQSRTHLGIHGSNTYTIARSFSDEAFDTVYTSSQDTETSSHRNAKRNGQPVPLVRDQITTKYRTGLKCCPCCLLFCRFGIYNDDGE